MLELNHAESLFNGLYSNINGYDISNAARRKTSLDTSRFLYGEIPFHTWKGIVELAKPKKDGVFVWAGSAGFATGKPDGLAFGQTKNDDPETTP